jgi:hypothetical protein
MPQLWVAPCETSGRGVDVAQGEWSSRAGSIRRRHWTTLYSDVADAVSSVKRYPETDRKSCCEVNFDLQRGAETPTDSVKSTCNGVQRKMRCQVFDSMCRVNLEPRAVGLIRVRPPRSCPTSTATHPSGSLFVFLHVIRIASSADEAMTDAILRPSQAMLKRRFMMVLLFPLVRGRHRNHLHQKSIRAAKQSNAGRQAALDV